MPVSQFAKVTVAAYNNVRNIIVPIIGTGGGVGVLNASKGYGQTVQSVGKSAGDIVDQTDWDNLRFDIANSRIHQVGSAALTDLGVTDKVGATEINNYETLSNTSSTTAERFKVAAGQFITNNLQVTSRTWSASTTPQFWSNSMSVTHTITFNSANDARYFFNSGGEIRVQSSRTGGRSDQQNNAWSTVLSSASLKSFGGIYAGVGTSGSSTYYLAQDGFNWYNLSNSFIELFHQRDSVPYASNEYRIEVRSNAASNVNGTATVLDVRTSFIAGYTDPGPLGPPFTNDELDGVWTVTVSEKRADSAGFLPSGNFTILQPTINTPSITGS